VVFSFNPPGNGDGEFALSLRSSWRMLIVLTMCLMLGPRLTDAQNRGEPLRQYQGSPSRAATRSPLEFHASLSTNPRILLVVEQDLAPQIQPAIATYTSDLSAEGFDVTTTTVSASASPPEIRALLAAEYANGDLVGALLVGDISGAYTEIHTGDFSDPNAWLVWISLDAFDMYYMDLDGTYEHVDHPEIPGTVPPHVAQVSVYPSCTTFIDEYIVYMGGYQYRWGEYHNILDHAQYAPEIWVARIMGHNLELEENRAVKTEAEVVNDYLASNHLLRTDRWGVANRGRLCDAISDDDPSHGLDFSGVFATTTEHGLITKVEYLNLLQEPSGNKVMLLTSHSWPQGHSFDDGHLPVSELEQSAKTAAFYILNACSSCRWDQFVSDPDNPDYLGGMYVFDKSACDDCGQGAIGFTGVGGFNFLENFSSYLQAQPSATYGDAFRYYFETYLTLIFGPLNFVFLGDPTVTPRHGDSGQPCFDIFADGLECGSTFYWSARTGIVCQGIQCDPGELCLPYPNGGYPLGDPHCCAEPCWNNVELGPFCCAEPSVCIPGVGCAAP